MQVARTLQKAWRDLESNSTNILRPALISSVAGAMDFYWFPRSANQAALPAPKKVVTAAGEFVAPLL
jgi:hypothetical protein